MEELSYKVAIIHVCQWNGHIFSDTLLLVSWSRQFINLNINSIMNGSLLGHKNLPHLLKWAQTWHISTQTNDTAKFCFHPSFKSVYINIIICTCIKFVHKYQ